MNQTTMWAKSYRIVISCLLIFPCLYACSPPGTPNPTVVQAGEEESKGVGQDYILGAEDNIEVQVWKNPDLSRTVVVRPDGKISLPLIGDVQAAGQTAAQLTDAVTDKLKTYYKEPAQVSVIVHQVNSYGIYILGEVRGQGKQVVRSGTTFLQALTLAGGFTPFASTKKITLRRKGSDGKETLTPIRYKDVLAGSQADIVLKPGDIIIVP